MTEPHPRDQDELVAQELETAAGGTLPPQSNCGGNCACEPVEPGPMLISG